MYYVLADVTFNNAPQLFVQIILLACYHPLFVQITLLACYHPLRSPLPLLPLDRR